MKKIKFAKKEVVLVLTALVVIGAQSVHTYNVRTESEAQHEKVKKLKRELGTSNESIDKLIKQLSDTNSNLDNKSKEAKDLQDKLKQEQENVEKIKSELDDALAKKEERKNQMYAMSENSQEVAQNTEYSGQQESKPSMSGSKSMVMEATAYDGYSMGGMTASGVRINSQGDRVIAVDPSVIPLGSRVYVEGYGEAIAADTGGAIVGNIIDLNMSQAEAIAWGRRPVNVTILS